MDENERTSVKTPRLHRRAWHGRTECAFFWPADIICNRAQQLIIEHAMKK